MIYGFVIMLTRRNKGYKQRFYEHSNVSLNDLMEQWLVNPSCVIDSLKFASHFVTVAGYHSVVYNKTKIKKYESIIHLGGSVKEQYITYST